MKRNAVNVFAIIIGWFLLAEGIWGFFSPIVFGVLTTNTAHAVIEVILGVMGIGLGYATRARVFVWFLGTLLLTVGVLRFIPGTSAIMVDLLNVNYAVAILNIIVAAVAFMTAGLGIRHRGTMPKHPTMA